LHRKFTSDRLFFSGTPYLDLEVDHSELGTSGLDAGHPRLIDRRLILT
jgi:hypothetical protein